MSQFNYISDKYLEKTNDYNQKKRKCFNYISSLIAKVTTKLQWPVDKIFYLLSNDKHIGFSDENNVTRIKYLDAIARTDINEIITFNRDSILEVNLCLESSKKHTRCTTFNSPVQINFVLSISVEENDNEISVKTSVTEKSFPFTNTEMNHDQNIADISQAIINKLENTLDEFYLIKQNQGETKSLYIKI